MGDRRFDLIIDDGLHLPQANSTPWVLFCLLSEDGIFVVEDINGYYPFWSAASLVLNQRYDTHFTARKSASIIYLHRRQRKGAEI